LYLVAQDKGVKRTITKIVTCIGWMFGIYR